jgi:DNA repair protein RecO (recombination protein O)
VAIESEGHFLILKKIKYSEADLIIHALSQEGEKMSFLARGALRSKKRFGGGVLEPTHHVKLTYSTSPQSDMHTLKEAQLLQGFEQIRTDYDKLDFALAALNFVSQVSMEGDSNSSTMYNLLGHLLKKIETVKSPDDLVLLKVQFYLKFLLQQGVLDVEDWMRPFLKLNLQDPESFAALAAQKTVAAGRVVSLEKSVLHYVKSAVL